MDFELNADQESLQEGVRAFVEGRVPLDTVRELEAAGSRIDRALWAELGEMGVFSIALPEDQGGLGLGVSEAALVFEELGRGIVPGPLVGTALAAGIVDGAAAGETVVAVLEPAEPITVVEFPADVDALLLLADDGIRRVDPASLATTPVAVPTDALTPLAVVTSSVPGGPEFDGELIADAAASQRARLVGSTLTAALQVGVALRATELATQYAKEREQFGKVIGSFQAVKHICADMLIRAEVARVAVYAAAVALDGKSDDDAERAAASAKCVAGDAALQNGKWGIQVHGGNGYTWEFDIGRYWKRACVLDTQFGNSDEHALRVAEMV
jgi:alkylation response protein AidB-like acyl-CoA dehydrogenase